MKTSYSRRELYALGEPIGESSTYELAGRRVYGGGGGGLGDLVGGVTDAIGGAVDAVGDLGQGAIDTVKENPELAAAAALYFGMPSGIEGLGGAGGLGEFAGTDAGIAGLGDAGAWDAATAGDYGGELFGGPASDAGAWDAATSGDYGGPTSSGSGFGSQVAKMLGQSITGQPGGLTLGGGLLGGAGIAALMNMIKQDNKRYGTPGRRDMMSPMNQFNYNPATFSAPKVDPAAFRPVGAPTAKVGYAYGGPVESMSQANSVGMNTGYPQADITGHAYATPWQTPVSQNVVSGTADTGVNRMTGEMFAEGGVTGQGSIELNVPLSIGGDGGALGQFGQSMQGGFPASASSPFRGYNNTPSMDSVMSNPQQFGLDKNAIAANPQQFASMYQQARQREQSMPGSTFLGQNRFMNNGGISGLMTYAGGGNVSNLGGYSDGGRMLKGPGDGMSDSIPASISGKQPARLADGEFVVPADVVSHLGNGSTDAGAKQLYKMMDKVRTARTGRKDQGRQINPKKYMPA